MNKVAVVTGGSSGIGLETSKALLTKGYTVYSINRKDFNHEEIKYIKADVTNIDEVKNAIDTICKKENRIDLLVNSAGFGFASAIEFTSKEEAFNQFNVGFFGVDNVIKKVLPIMRKQGEGKIINVSSLGALAPLPFQAYYSAMKAAVNTYTCALRSEIGIYGIEVCAVMPSDIKSNFTSSRIASNNGDKEYDGRISKAIEKMAQDEQNGPSAEFAGRFIASLALKKKLKPLVAIEPLSKIEAVLFKLLPIRLSNYIVGKIYGQH